METAAKVAWWAPDCAEPGFHAKVPLAPSNVAPSGRPVASRVTEPPLRVRGDDLKGQQFAGDGGLVADRIQHRRAVARGDAHGDHNFRRERLAAMVSAMIRHGEADAGVCTGLRARRCPGEGTGIGIDPGARWQVLGAERQQVALGVGGGQSEGRVHALGRDDVVRLRQGRRTVVPVVLQHHVDAGDGLPGKNLDDPGLRGQSLSGVPLRVDWDIYARGQESISARRHIEEGARLVVAHVEPADDVGVSIDKNHPSAVRPVDDTKLPLNAAERREIDVHPRQGLSRRHDDGRCGRHRGLVRIPSPPRISLFSVQSQQV